MALNKAQTNLGVKIVLIMVAVAMVGFLFPAVFSLFSGSNSTQTTGSTTTAQGTLDQIATKYNAQVASNDQALKNDPNNYETLTAQGNTYYDWALEVSQAAQKNQSLAGSDQPLWLAARQFYERALAVKPGDPSVSTDLSIAYYYSGDTTQAVGVVTKVTQASPDFAPGWFNLGVFLAAQGDRPRAIVAFGKSIELDPKGEKTNLDYAKQQLTALKEGSTSTTTAP